MFTIILALIGAIVDAIIIFMIALGLFFLPFVVIYKIVKGVKNAS